MSRVLKEAVKSAFALLPSVSVPAVYAKRLGRWPNLQNPAGFNEKVTRAKLEWRDPRLATLVDKVEAKVFVEKLLGKQWVIPTFYVGRELPPVPLRNWPRPFVIKVNHNSGGNAFIKLGDEVDWSATDRKVSEWLRYRYNPHFGEKPYDHVERRVLVEPMIGGGSAINDYKIFVFGGEPHFVQVDVDRFGLHRRGFYDMLWNRMPFTLEYPGLTSDVAKPSSLDTMAEAASTLSAGLPFARIDFYEVDDRPYFGEITLFPETGTGRFSPAEYDRIIGNYWRDGFSLPDDLPPYKPTVRSS